MQGKVTYNDFPKLFVISNCVLSVLQLVLCSINKVAQSMGWTSGHGISLPYYVLTGCGAQPDSLKLTTHLFLIPKSSMCGVLTCVPFAVWFGASSHD